MKRTLVVLLFSLLQFPLLVEGIDAQPVGSCELQGHVVGYGDSSQHVPLNMALVALIDVNDTLRVTTALSGSDGRYSLAGLDTGHYRLVAQMVGYTSYDTLVTLSQPGERKSVDALLREKNVEIEDVRVSASRIGKLGEQHYSFTQANVKLSKSSEQLLLTLPFFTRDAQGGIVFSDDRSQPLFLLNGQPSNIEELRSIPKDKMLRIDYYEIPPYRYRTTSRVIDVITKELDAGHYGSVSLNLEPLGYMAYGSLFYGYHQGRHGVTLDANTFFFRPRRDNTISSEESYDIPGAQLALKGKGTRSFLNVTPHLALAYTYNRNNQDIFRFTAKADATIADYWNEQAINMEHNSLKSQYIQRGKGAQRLYSPTLDAYYLHQFANQGELFTNVVFSYGSTQESSGRQFEYKKIGATARPGQEASWLAVNTGMIGHVQYDHPYKKWLFSVGVVTDNMWFSTHSGVDIKGQPHRERNTREFRTENTLLFRASWRPTNRFSCAFLTEASSWLRGAGDAAGREHQFFFHPTVDFTWLPDGKDHKLIYRFKMGYGTPDPSYYATVPLSYEEGYFSATNPNLENSISYYNRLLYIWTAQSKYYVALEVVSSHVSNKVVGINRPGTYDGETVLVGWAENAKWSSDLTGQLWLVYTPLGDARLEIWANGGPKYMAIALKDGTRYNHLTYKFNGGIMSTLGKVFFGASTGKLDDRLSVSGVTSYTWAVYCNVGATLGDWTLRAFLEHIVIPLRYDSYSNAGNILTYSKSTTEWRKHWSAQVQFTYNFRIGRQYNAPDIKANHSVEQLRGGLQL